MSFTQEDVGIYPVKTAIDMDTQVMRAENAGGGIISLPPTTLIGHWDYSSVTVPLTFIGVPNKTELKWPDHHTNTGSTRTGDFGGPDGSNVLLKLGSNVVARDIILNGNLANQTPASTSEGCNGITFRDQQNVKLINIETKNMVHMGIVLTNVPDFLLQDCYCHDHYIGSATIWPDWTYEHSGGIHIRGWLTDNRMTGRVLNCRCHHLGADGLNIQAVDEVEVIGGFYNYCGLGMENWNGNQPYTGTTVGAGGVYICDAADDIVLIGVTANYNTETGIQYDGSNSTNANARIIGCTTKFNNDAGIGIRATSSAQVTGNYSYNNGGGASSTARDAGIWIENSSYATVTNNHCKESRAGAERKQRYGVSQVNSTGTTCKNNTLLGNYVSPFNGTDYSSDNTVG